MAHVMIPTPEQIAGLWSLLGHPDPTLRQQGVEILRVLVPSQWRGCLHGAPLDGVVLAQMSIGAVELSGASMKQARLSGVDLSGAHLKQTDLRGADLRNANLQGALLSGVDLRGADLRGADLRGANVQDGQLQRARLDRCRFDGARLQGCCLMGAAVVQVSFREAQLCGASFRDARLEHVDFRGAHWEEGMDLRSSVWTAVLVDQLDRMDLRGADLSNMSLQSVRQGKVQWDERTRWPSSSHL